MIDVLLTSELDLQYDPVTGDLLSTNDIEGCVVTALFSDKDLNFSLEESEGSYLWKTYQNRLTSVLLADIRAYVRDSLTFLEDDNYISNLKVEVLVENNSKIKIKITMLKLDNVSITKEFYL